MSGCKITREVCPNEEYCNKNFKTATLLAAACIYEK